MKTLGNDLPEVNFGKTPYKVKKLGFGIMRLPMLQDGKVDFELSTPMIRYAIEHGVNFLDSHHFYHNGESEEAIGRAVQGIPRNKIILQTKIGMYNNYTEKECWRLLEQALRKMKTDYLDFYFSHSLSWENHLKYGKSFLSFTEKALNQGLIRYRGFSAHDKPENIKKIIISGEFSAMLVQYNLLDRSNEEVIALACERGLGVEIMGPLAGGMLGFPDEKIMKYSPVKVKSTAELALKFVLANPNIHVAFSGMNTLGQVAENIASVVSTSRFSRNDIGKLDQIFENQKKLLNLYCTGCGYCLPCPNKVNIPSIFRLYNFAQVYGLVKKAKKDYRALNPEEKASRCLACGKCEEKCPQKIPIQKKLKQIKNYFEK
ncbi:MAG: aldo/keto reductase [Candidatus Omnitrophica bacterium]|nr:aldo/keto reductase [Candidatus Omnitrophota bacterium]